MPQSIEEICSHSPSESDLLPLSPAPQQKGPDRFRDIALPSGTVLLNRYHLEHVLGAGGFGITYLAFDSITQSRRAIKEFYPSALVYRERDGRVFSAPAHQDHYNHSLMRFYEEAKNLAKFRGTPGIVEVENCFRQYQTAYIAMEYIDGPNLKHWLRERQQLLPWHQALPLLQVIAPALQTVHRAGLLHRDISPENILISQAGVKLIDFGAARQFAERQSRQLSVILKPGFAPPEQYSSNGHQGPWTDVYALASTFYYLMSGSRIPDAMDRLSGAPLPALTQLVGDMDPRLSAAFERALSLKPSQRHQSMEEFLLEILPQAPFSPPSPQASRFWVKIFYQRQMVARLPLTPGQVALGRSIYLERLPGAVCSEISRHHCTISLGANGALTLLDQSRNGTFVRQGLRLRAGNPYPLAPGEPFWLASPQFVVKVVDGC